MKTKLFKFCFIPLLYFALAYCIAGKVNAQGFYDVSTINKVEIYFSETNWDQILDSLYATGDENRLLATTMINGIQFDSVAVRYKGNSSYAVDRVKNPLNISLDNVISGQNIDGYGKLRLSNGFKDPSMVREIMSFEIARKYMPASEANYMNVYINGTLIGLYTSVQDIDSYFLRTHYHDDNNVFFKGEISGGPPSGTWSWYGSDSISYFNSYELESDYGWNQLINFLDTLNNFPQYTENVLDVDNHLWMLAFDVLMVNLDAPINFAHNYYMYKDEAKQFNPIVWDLNENFGGFTNLFGSPPLNVTTMIEMDPFLYSNKPQYPILHRILSNPMYKRMYTAHMKTIIEENFSNGWYTTRAGELQNLINADIQADVNKFYTYQDFLSNINNSINNVVGITQLMEARVGYINGFAEFQAAAPEISNISYSTGTVNPNTIIDLTAQISNAGFAYIGMRHSVLDKFEKLIMFDDGAHNDGAAGDGLYGVKVEIHSNDVQYYIYAENDSAGKFSPVRAEYEFYTIPVQVDLVINELMASNGSTASDISGEFDDWIEFYNKATTDLSLKGYFLSDDSEDLSKYSFPDTTIGAGEYIIVWADNDELQTGLHAGFKLTSNGESLFLSDPLLSIIDQVSFGVQTTDISYARVPNGYGPFILKQPTYGYNNDSISSVGEYPDGQIIRVFPNPAKEIVIVETNSFNNERIELRTLTGELLFETETQTGRSTINTSKLASGIYILKAGTKTEKIVILKD